MRSHADSLKLLPTGSVLSLRRDSRERSKRRVSSSISPAAGDRSRGVRGGVIEFRLNPRVFCSALPCWANRPAVAIGGPPMTFIGVPIFIPIVSVSLVGAPAVNGFGGIGKAIVISKYEIGSHNDVKIQCQ